MAQFTLKWKVDALDDNTNTTHQVASYRLRGSTSWLTDAFPDNPMDIAQIITTTDNVLLDNMVYQFKVDAICTIGGPTPVENGLREQIRFKCIAPTIVTPDSYSSQISVTVTPHITKVKFYLYEDITPKPPAKYTKDIIPSSSNFVAATSYDDLDPDTDYIWEYIMYSTINGTTEVNSGSATYLGIRCAYPTQTPPLPVCNAPTSLTVTATNA